MSFLHSLATRASRSSFFFLAAYLFAGVNAVLNITQDSAQLILQNDRLFAAVNKATGGVYALYLDGQNLLGHESAVDPTPGGVRYKSFTFSYEILDLSRLI